MYVCTYIICNCLFIPSKSRPLVSESGASYQSLSYTLDSKYLYLSSQITYKLFASPLYNQSFTLHLPHTPPVKNKIGPLGTFGVHSV